MNSLEIQKRRKAVFDKLNKLNAATERESRNLTEAEQKEWDADLAEYESLAERLKRADQLGALDKRQATELESRLHFAADDPGRTVRAANPPDRWLDTRTGKEVRTFGPEDRLCDTYDNAGIGMGEIFAASVNNPHYRDVRESRDFSGLGDISGGLWLTPQLSMPTLDQVRARAVGLLAGVRIIPMDQAELRIAKWMGDVSAQFLGQNVAATKSNATLGATTLHARTLRIHQMVSEEVLMDAPNAADEINKLMSTALAAGLDQAILFGGVDGDQESPKGLRVIDGTTEQGSVGLPTNYDDFATAFQTVQTNNAPGDAPVSVIGHPRTFGIQDRLKTGISSDETPLRPPESWKQMQKFATSSISIVEGVGSDESFAIVGPFSTAILGMRMQVQLMMRPDSDQQYQRELIAAVRVDFAVPRPAFFVKLTGITAS